MILVLVLISIWLGCGGSNLLQTVSILWLPTIPFSIDQMIQPEEEICTQMEDTHWLRFYHTYDDNPFALLQISFGDMVDDIIHDLKSLRRGKSGKG